MKICHIITTLVYGGAERLLVEIAKIHTNSHEIDIIYLKGTPHLASQLPPSVRVHHIPLNFSTATNIRNLLKVLQPDVVHTHLGHADFIGLWAARGLPLQTFCTMHNIWFKWDWRDYLYFVGYRLLFKFVVPSCHVIGISQSVSQHVKSWLGVPPERVSTIYNAIPNVEIQYKQHELRTMYGIPSDAFCILFVGRLRIQKSVDTLLQASTQLKDQIPNLLILIVGEGKGYEEDNLRELSRQLNLNDTVRFCGTTKSPEHYFVAADLFVLPSVFEGLPLVVLEAFRAALPVIATDIEGPREIVKHGWNGLLFPPKDIDALVKHVRSLYDDVVRRKQIGEQGYERFKEQFSMNKYVDALEQLYQTSNEIKR